MRLGLINPHRGGFISSNFISNKNGMTSYVRLTKPTTICINKRYYWSKNFKKSGAQVIKNIPSMLISSAIYKKNYLQALILSMVYPFFWIFYLLLPKIYRLDTTRNVYGFISEINPHVIITTLLIIYYFLPIIISLCENIIKKIKNIKEYLWVYTGALFYGCHLKLLVYNKYFKLYVYIYKSVFIFHDIFAGNPGATWDCYKHYHPFYRKILAHLYFGYARIYFLIIIFSLIGVEIIITNGTIHYGLYLLFIAPIILSIFRFFINSILGSQLILDVCIADYRSQNFTHPRYPRKFWVYMQAPKEYFGIVYPMSPILHTAVCNMLALNLAIIEHSRKFYNTDILYRSWGLRHIPGKIIKHAGAHTYFIPGYIKYSGDPKPWGFRLAAKYKKSHGVRWYHSSPMLYYPLPERIHPLTIHFIKNNVYALLAYTNKASLIYSDMQKITSKIKFPSPTELYTPFDTALIMVPHDKTNLVETLEVNFVMRFKQLTYNNVVIGTYDKIKSIIEYKNLESMQMRPDMVSIWHHQSFFIFKGILGIDQKHKAPTVYGRNQAISRPVENYNDLLEEYLKNLVEKFPLINKEAINAIENLKNSHSDPDQHINIWANSLHLFPEKWTPPLLLEKTFDDSKLNQQALALIRDGEAIIVHISDKLYALNVPEEGTFDHEALDNFDGSHIQKLLGDEEHNNHTDNQDSLDVD